MVSPNLNPLAPTFVAHAERGLLANPVAGKELPQVVLNGVVCSQPRLYMVAATRLIPLLAHVHAPLGMVRTCPLAFQ